MASWFWWIALAVVLAQGPTTTTTAQPSQPALTFELQVVLIIIYPGDLSNPQSQAFRGLATQVIAEGDYIYSSRYGTLFVRTIVRSFRRSSPGRVETKVELVFSRDSTEPLPQSSDIVDTLKQAVNLPLPVDVNSITVTSALQTISNVQFATNETFVPELSNSSSTAFKDRASLIKRELEPFFIQDFQPFFIRLTATSFSQGSIIHEVTLTFTANASLPTSTAIQSTMLRAAQSGNLTFTITSLNGKDSSSGAISCMNSLFMAWILVAVPLLEPWQWLA